MLTVSALKATTSGNLTLANAGGLTFSDGLGAVNTVVSAPSGTVTVTATSPITISDNVISSGSVTMDALETSDPGVWADVLSVGANVTVQSTASSVTLRAGDDLTTAAGSLIDGATNVTLRAGFNDVDGRGDLILNGAVTTGGTLDLSSYGDLTIGALTASGTVTLTSTSGAIIDGNGNATNVTAPTLNMSAATGIGITAPGNELENIVSNLSATTGTGGIGLINSGALNVTGLSATTSGNIALANSSTVTVSGPVSATSGTVTLSGIGALAVNANVSASGAINLSAADTAAPTDHLTVASGVSVISSGSSVMLLAGDNVVLNGGVTPQVSASTTVTVTAANGDVDNLGGITANGAILGGGLVSLTARDTITLSANVTSTGSNLVYTSSQGAITRTAGTSSGSLLTGSARTGITLVTAISTLNVTNSTSGNIIVTENDALTISNATTLGGNGNIDISNVTNNSDITATGLIAANGSGTVTLLALGTLNLADTVVGDDVKSATGNITLRGNSGVNLNDAHVFTAGDISIDGDANLASNTGPITTGASGLVTGNNLTAYSAQGITLNTSVNTLTATNTFSGGITIVETNGLALNLASNLTRDVSITLSAGALTDNNGAVSNVDSATLTASSVTGIDLDTNITTLTSATVSGAGAIDINDLSGGLAVSAASAANGSVTIQTTGSVLALNGNVSGTAGIALTGVGITQAGASTVNGAASAITLDANDGAVSLAGLLTTTNASATAVVIRDATTAAIGNVTATSGTLVLGQSGGDNLSGAITQTSGTTVSVNTLASNAGASLTLTNNNSIGSISTITAGGNVSIRDTAGDLNLGSVTATGQVVTIENTTGQLLDSNVGTDITAITVNLSALSGIGVGAGGAIETAASNLKAITATGGIAVDNTGALNITDTGAFNPANAGFGARATTSGNISINSGALTVSGDISTPGNVTLNSTGSITETTGAVKIAALLNTTSVGGQTLNGANTVVSFDGTNTGSGSIGLINTAATLTIHRIANLVGNATVVNNGNIQLGDASNLNVNVSGIANISALAGAITDGNGATNNITALAAILAAGNGIGTNADRIETTIANLEATGGSGGVFIAETDALTIGGISPIDGVSATGGDIKISSGALSITEQIRTPADVVLDAAGTIVESGAGYISAANLTNTSAGGETLNGNNTVGSFSATNTGAGTGISLQNDFDGFDIRNVENRTGGDVFINNTNDFDASGENDANVTGTIRSGNPSLGGDITICTSGLLTVTSTGVIDSSTGTGGTLTIQDRVTVLTGATITTGFGDVTLKGGAGSIIITAPISVDSPLVLRATDDINILEKVETTSTLSDITIQADFDNNGVGGVLIDGAGEVKAGRDVSVTGSNYVGSVRADLALLNDAVIIEPNGSNTRLSALGNVFVDVNGAALATSRIWLGGLVRSSGTGNVTFDNAILVTHNDARVTTNGSGNVIFFREVDSRGGAGSPFNLRASTDNGLVLFNGAVGATTPLGDIAVATALDITAASTLSARSFSVGEASGTVRFEGAVTTTGTGINNSVNTKNLVVNAAVDATATGANLGNIFWQTDNIAIAANVAGDGALTIQPQAANRTIGINAAGDLNLTTAEVSFLQNGFAAIQIGRPDGSGAITTGAVTFLDPVSVLSPLSSGSISVNGAFAGIDDASVTMIAPTINLNVAAPTAAISTEADAVQLTGSVKLLANTLLRTNFGGAGGDVTVAGSINGAFGLQIDAADLAAGGTVSFGGAAANPAGGASIGGSTPLSSILVQAGTINLLPQIITKGAQTYNANNAINAFAGALRSQTSGAITLDGPLHLNQDLPIITSGTAGANIVFTSTVDGIGATGGLSLNAGASGDVLFQGNVGSTIAPAKIEVIDSATFTASGGLHALNSISIDSGEITFGGGANSVGTTNGHITLQTDGTSTAVLVGGATDPGATTLHLSTSDLAALDGNSALITIARTTGTGGLTIDAAGANFRSPVELRQSARTGGISVLGNVTGTGSASLAFYSAATTLNANLSTQGQPIYLDNAVLGAGSNLVSITTGAGADVTFGGSLLVAGGGAHNLTVTAGTGTVAFAGTVGKTSAKPGVLDVTAAQINVGSSFYASSVSFTGNTELRGNLASTTGAQTYIGNVTLASGMQFATTGGAVYIAGTIDSASTTLNALKFVTKAGDVTVDGAIGSNHALGTVSVTTTGTATFGGSIAARSLTVTAPHFNVKTVTTTNGQIYKGIGTFGGALTADSLKITSKAAISIAAPVVVDGTASFQAKGFDVSVPNTASNFGLIDVTARHATFGESNATDLRSIKLTGTLTVNSAGDIGQSGRLTVNALNVISGGKVTLDGAVTTLHSIQKIQAQTGVLVTSSGGTLFLDGTTSTVSGDIILSANKGTSKYNIINHVGASAISNGSGRFLIYAYDKSSSNVAGITFNATELGLRYPDLPANPGNVAIFYRA